MEGLVQILEDSGYGCTIDDEYFGVLMYADDIVLISPSITGLQEMVNTRSRYMMEHNLLLNENKSECVFFSDDGELIPCPIFLNNKPLIWKDSVKHLGHIVDNTNRMNLDIINRQNKFMSCVNYINNEFSFATYKCKLEMIRIYGTNFYGSNLWDFSSKPYQKLCTAWRVVMRKIMKLDRRTHSRYLPYVSGMESLDVLLKCRYMKFLCKIKYCNNNITTTLYNNAMSRKCSLTYNSFLMAHDIPLSYNNDEMGHNDVEVSCAIGELLDVKDGLLQMSDFSGRDVEDILCCLCTA